MIKALQKKFIITAMTAISVLLIILLGAINIINIVSIGKATEQTLSIISESEGDFKNLKPINDEPMHEPPQNFRHGEKNDYDTFMSSNFFVVCFNFDGQIIKTDVSRTSTVTESDAQSLAREVVAAQSDEGKTGKYRFRLSPTADGGTVIVFLDTSNETMSYLRILALSLLVGIVCWSLMLAFVILLSKKAIKPIAQNIEKQKQFITNAGHEIKTPIAIIQSNTEAMELYNGENKWSKNIKAQIARLNGLMNDLLFLAKMDESSNKPACEKIVIGEILEKSISGFKASAEQKTVDFSTEIDTSAVIFADKMQIEQLFSIMLDNAVKYVDENGKISIILKKSEKHIQIEFFNTCASLPDVEPNRLFDRFFRGDKARTQKSGGYGIGLSVAKSIVDSNGGTISAEYINNGIKFIIKI